MTRPAEEITWEQLRPYEDGPCMAVGCSDPVVEAAAIIDGHRYRLCAADCADIPGFTSPPVEGSHGVG